MFEINHHATLKQSWLNYVLVNFLVLCLALMALLDNHVLHKFQYLQLLYLSLQSSISVLCCYFFTDFQFNKLTKKNWTILKLSQKDICQEQYRSRVFGNGKYRTDKSAIKKVKQFFFEIKQRAYWLNKGNNGTSKNILIDIFFHEGFKQIVWRVLLEVLNDVLKKLLLIDLIDTKQDF